MKSTIRHAQLRIPSSSSFVCTRCRIRNLRPVVQSTAGFSAYATRRYANISNKDKDGNEIPYTEKIRRKMWGTNFPPGQRDPYKHMTPEEREAEAIEMEQERLEAEAKARGADALAVKEASNSTEYIPATTWEGLERIGGPTGWWEEAWDQENVFTG
jgi:hypothetical protein